MRLNAEQEAAVMSGAKNVIVSAGAGSGKTRVLIERIKWLLLTGVRPNSIVAITYTNMAAQEMQCRLQEVPNSGDVFVGTIHSFANKLLRNSGKPYDIYNEQHQNNIMRYLCRKYARHLSHDRYLEWMECKKLYDLGQADGSVFEQFTKAERFELSLFFDHAIPSKDDEYPETVWTLAKRRHIITFDELLKLSGEYFDKLEHTTIDHLLVDELQDIGYLEYKFLVALKPLNNFFVGDDWQAIYSFKGGNVNIFKGLIESEDWERIDLTTNYRCGQVIVDVAESVISQCSDRVLKDITLPEWHSKGHVIEDSKYKLESYLRDIVDESTDLTKWLVLVRSNRDLVEVADRVTKLGIPCDTFKKSDFSFTELQDLLSRNSLKVLTVHMAKGLEADNVIMWGPFQVDPPKYLVKKEERRIMYVGITRARKKCIILR